jgi:hypothetical protein
MRRSPSPLRATSSPSAELGVDVAGLRNMRQACFQPFNQQPEVSSFCLGHLVGSTHPQIGARSMCRHPGDVIAGPSAAPNPQSLRRRYEFENML